MLFTQVLLAVVIIAQDSTAPLPTRVRPPVFSLAPLAAADMRLQQAVMALAAAQPQLQQLKLHAPVLAAAQARLGMLAHQLPMMLAPLAAVGPALAIDPFDFDVNVDVNIDEIDTQEPGDSLFRAARQVLGRGQYTRAVDLFRQFRDRYPRSEHVGNSYYWEAFALYRTGSADALRTAQTALRTVIDRYPRATTRRDAEALLPRVQGELARRGDAQAAQAISETVDSIVPRTSASASASASATPARPPREPRPPKVPRPPRNGRSSGCDDDDDMRIAALNAVLQMDAERAVPLLKTVLARRDSGSTCLRRKAVFLVSQKRSPETSAILLDAVRGDPDQEVREQAVFWLSQVPGEEAVTALDSVLRSSRDAAVQEKAIFALSQHRSERAGAILRQYVERRDAPAHLREQAIFWLSQHRAADNQAFLRNLYGRLDSPELKEKVLFSVSQMRGEDNARWLLDIALNEREDIELRKKALFWAGQSRAAPTADFVALYDRVQNREMKEQLIFVLSQRREGAAIDKLFAIARTEPDRELRKKAIFWIGQSRDPRAAQFLQEIINQ